MHCLKTEAPVSKEEEEERSSHYKRNTRIKALFRRLRVPRFFGRWEFPDSSLPLVDFFSNELSD
jgi:hypothetical protein